MFHSKKVFCALLQGEEKKKKNERLRAQHTKKPSLKCSPADDGNFLMSFVAIVLYMFFGKFRLLFARISSFRDGVKAANLFAPRPRNRKDHGRTYVASQYLNGSHSFSCYHEVLVFRSLCYNCCRIYY